MRGGVRLKERADLVILREASAAMIGALPTPLRALDKAEEPYPVVESDRLRADASALAARLSRARADPPVRPLGPNFDSDLCDLGWSQRDRQLCDSCTPQNR